MVLGITNNYEETAATTVNRLHLVIGRGVPVAIMRELDVKVDDGVPDTGVVRATLPTPTVFLGTNSWGGSDTVTACTDLTQTPSIWDVSKNSSDCNGVYLF